jgi:hypothetical protein
MWTIFARYAICFVASFVFFTLARICNDFRRHAGYEFAWEREGRERFRREILRDLEDMHQRRSDRILGPV